MVADRDVCLLLSKSCQTWQLRVAGWHPGVSDPGLWSPIPCCCGLCCGMDEHLSAFPVLCFLMAVSAPPSCSQPCIVYGWQPSWGWQTCWHRAAVLGYVYLPSNMLSPSPLGTSYLALWRGLLAPLEITTERAAVCQPPPDLLNWVVVNLLLEEFPTQQTFITWKPYHRWFWVFYNPLNSLHNIKHTASTHLGNSQEIGNSWVF